MKINYKEPENNVNVSSVSPVRELFQILGAIVFVVVLIYVLLGVAVDFIVYKYPIQADRKLGEIFSRTFSHNDSTPQEKQLQQLLDDLLKYSPSQKSAYTIHIIDDCSANALALPGNNIIIYSGLLKQAQSENELSFVIAHELGHFANNDHLRGMGRGLVFFVMMIPLSASNGSVSSLIAELAQDTEMKFSQAQESAADLWALDLLNKKYSHAAGSVDFLERQAKSDNMPKWLYFFNTHSHPGERVEIINNKIQEKGYILKEKTPINLK